MRTAVEAKTGFMGAAGAWSYCTCLQTFDAAGCWPLSGFAQRNACRPVFPANDVFMGRELQSGQNAFMPMEHTHRHTVHGNGLR